MNNISFLVGNGTITVCVFIDIEFEFVPILFEDADLEEDDDVDGEAVEDELKRDGRDDVLVVEEGTYRVMCSSKV